MGVVVMVFELVFGICGGSDGCGQFCWLLEERVIVVDVVRGRYGYCGDFLLPYPHPRDSHLITVAL